MAAYIIFIRENAILDPAEMAKYGEKAGNAPNNSGLKALSVYGAMTALEGNAPEGIVLLEFPTIEDAKAWYHSPEYQDAAAHRRKAADYRVVMFEGF